MPSLFDEADRATAGIYDDAQVEGREEKAAPAAVAEWVPTPDEGGDPQIVKWPPSDPT